MKKRIMYSVMLNSLAVVAKRLCGLFNKKIKAAEHDRNGQKKSATVDSGKEDWDWLRKIQREAYDEIRAEDVLRKERIAKRISL